MDMQKILVDSALSQVGIRESGGNNCGPEVVQYQKATWLKPGAWPWCAAFTCWVLQELLKNDQVLQALKLSKTNVSKWRCRDASAFGWETWARKNSIRILTESELAKAGDFVVFDFSHIGIVIADQLTLQESIQTVEGNTNGKGERDSVSGDGVWKKQRSPELVKSYIRIFG